MGTKRKAEEGSPTSSISKRGRTSGSSEEQKTLEETLVPEKKQETSDGEEATSDGKPAGKHRPLLLGFQLH